MNITLELQKLDDLIVKHTQPPVTAIPLDPRAHTTAMGDEHTVLEWQGDLPPLGAQIQLRPTQNRTTFNLHDVVWLVRNGCVVEKLPVAARGKSQ